ncbi:MAG: LamG-like jellyroll fold domain-containing protein [Nitrosotalea sp.]
MDNPQIIALVAIAISIISIGIVVADVLNLQTILINLNTNLVEQSQTIKSLNQQQNASQQLIEEQQNGIMKMQDNILNMTNEVKSLEDRVTTLEQRLSQNCLISDGCPPPPTHTSPTFVQGKIGQALSFDGIDDVVTVPNSPALNFGNGSFSISTWIKPVANASSGWIIDHFSNNDGVHAGYEIGYHSGHLRARIEENPTNTAFVDGTTKANDGLFYHVVLVVDRSTQTMKLYVDDNLQNNTNIANVGNTNTYLDLRIGGVTSPDTLVGFFNGTIDQTRIYNRALSSQEIQELYVETNSSTIPTNGLVGEWKFDGNTLDTVSASPLVGTITSP